MRRRTVPLLLVLMASAVLASTASGAAYTKNVYPPDNHGSYLRSWADLSRDCSGTYGCWNYMKIEEWRWPSWRFRSGNWANANGWNSITSGKSAGCQYYRTVIDSYNDVAGSYGSGVNIGAVGFSSNGTRIYRFKRTWASGYRRHC